MTRELVKAHIMIRDPTYLYQAISSYDGKIREHCAQFDDLAGLVE